MRTAIPTERAALNRIRLDRDLSFKALARDIGLTEAALWSLLTRDPVVVNDRTAHRIRTYLKRQQRGRRTA